MNLSEESKESTGAASMDVEAFVRDIAAYSNHRDRSVGIAGKGFTNFIRETYPTLLQGKDRGLKGSALHRAKAKPMRFGERNVAAGVEGADLLVEYESKKAAWLKRQQQRREAGLESDDDDEGEGEEAMIFHGDAENEDDEEAPELVVLDPSESSGKEEEDGDGASKKNGDKADGGEPVENEEDDVIDLSKMTREERDRLKQEVSSTRVFTAALRKCVV